MNFTLLFGHEYVHENTRNVALKVAQKSIQKNEQRSQMYEQRLFFFGFSKYTSCKQQHLVMKDVDLMI